MTRTSYIVTTGEYSDYRIQGVFSTKEKAQKAINRFGGEIEEHSIDPDFPSPKLGLFFVRMDREGNTTELVREDAGWYKAHNAAEKKWGFDVDGRMYATVFAKDKQHAAKIVNERRGQLIASGKWDREIARLLVGDFFKDREKIKQIIKNRETEIVEVER